MKKVILISVDGMRPDAVTKCDYFQTLKNISAYSLKGSTVFPPVTLPCHVSMFHGVDPSRHGTTTNVYAEQVRPIKSLCEVLTSVGKKCALFYTWHELRDLVKPGSVCKTDYIDGKTFGYEYANSYVAKQSINYLKNNDIDFSFVYFIFPDEAGHRSGWMSNDYLYAVNHSLNEIKTMVNELGSEYDFIITADHGGHARSHGVNIEEDMLIPLFIISDKYKTGETITNYSIIDIPKTVASMLEVTPDGDWEGKVL